MRFVSKFNIVFLWLYKVPLISFYLSEVGKWWALTAANDSYFKHCIFSWRTYIRLNYRLNELENTKRVALDSQSVLFNWFIVSDNVLSLPTYSSLQTVWPILISIYTLTLSRTHTHRYTPTSVLCLKCPQALLAIVPFDETKRMRQCLYLYSNCFVFK